MVKLSLAKAGLFIAINKFNLVDLQGEQMLSKSAEDLFAGRSSEMINDSKSKTGAWLQLVFLLSVGIP